MKTRASKRLALGAALIMATLAMNSAIADTSPPWKRVRLRCCRPSEFAGV